MKRAISLVATVVALSVALSASATEQSGNEHTIMILPDAYFPQVTYLDPGDTVHFLNVSGAPHNLVSKNDSWTIGPIQNEMQYTIVVDQEMQKTFYNSDAQGESGEYLVEGRMSFADAPLD